MSQAQAYGSVPNVDIEEAQTPVDEPPTLMQKCVAECFGTCVLVQVGCAGLCASTYLGVYEGLWQAAAVWLIGATLAVLATASISGAHLNPAVTLSFALMRPDDFTVSDVIPYWVAQLAGGILAGLINLSIYGTAIASFEAANNLVRGTDGGIASAVAFGDYYMLSPSVGSFMQAIFIEAFGTAFLVFIIFSVTNPKNDVPSSAVPLIVGTAIAAMIATLGATTGAGINPARDLGPRLVTLFMGWGTPAMNGSLVYIAGPMIGGPIGAFLADLILFSS